MLAYKVYGKTPRLLSTIIVMGQEIHVHKPVEMFSREQKPGWAFSSDGVQIAKYISPEGLSKDEAIVLFRTQATIKFDALRFSRLLFETVQNNKAAYVYSDI